MHLRKMEATGGFGPPNRSFADSCLNHLATSPRSLISCQMDWRRLSNRLIIYGKLRPCKSK